MDAIVVQTVALSLLLSRLKIVGPWVVAFSHKCRIKKNIWISHSDTRYGRYRTDSQELNEMEFNEL